MYVRRGAISDLGHPVSGSKIKIKKKDTTTKWYFKGLSDDLINVFYSSILKERFVYFVSVDCRRDRSSCGVSASSVNSVFISSSQRHCN